METIVAPKDAHELVQEVKSGVAQIHSSADWKRLLNMNAKMWKYSFHNQVLISMQKSDASLVAGFQTWKQMNRFVKKGEHGIRILAPVIVKLKEETDEGLRALRGFRVVCVFDVSQTEGNEIPSIYHPLKGEAPSGVLERLQGYIKAQGYSIRFDDIRTGAEGYLNKKREIVLRNGLSPAQTCDVLCHELAHGMLGHLEDKETPRDSQELEAETTAWIVCRALGLETRSTSFAYLATWSNSKERDEKLEKAGQKACECSKNILEGLEKT